MVAFVKKGGELIRREFKGAQQGWGGADRIGQQLLPERCSFGRVLPGNCGDDSHPASLEQLSFIGKGLLYTIARLRLIKRLD